MRKRLVSLIAFITMVFSNVALAGPPAEWGFQKLSAAMAVAKEAKKPVFLQFGHESCRGCSFLYSGAYRDERLRTTFQKNFILAYVDTEKYGEEDTYQIGNRSMTHAELVNEFRGSPTPSWVWLTPDGVILNGDRGGRTTEKELHRNSEIALEKFRAGSTGAATQKMSE